MSDVQWFVKPLDSRTNEAIAGFLGETGKISDEDTLEIEIPRESRGLVWRVEHRVISMLQSSKKSLNLRFRIFKRRGESGKVEEWKFGNKKVSKKAKARP